MSSAASASTLSSPPATTPPSFLTVVAKDSAAPFPMLDRIWDIFSGKGIRTVFVSIGNSACAMPDLEIAEGLGCPINYIPLTQTEKDQWSEVTTILKERKRDEATSKPFSVGAETKWILPKNVRAQAALPWWGCGTLDLCGCPQLTTASVENFAQSICSTMKLKDNMGRIDILKLDTVTAAPGLEKAIIGAVLNAGFRPAVIMVNWSKMPDVELSTTIAAGHLQNCGYRLMDKMDGKFLYYFTDDDLYQFCSWEVTTCQNPLLNEIARSAEASFKLGLLAKPAAAATPAESKSL